MENYNYILKRDYNEQDIHEVIALLEIVFPKATKFTFEYKLWQYCLNPNGKVVSHNAYTEKGELVAHYAAIPIKMIIGGKTELGLLSLDTATHPNHQGKGLFTKLANLTYNYARKEDYKFVIGVANINSTPGFLKKLDFYLVSPLSCKIGFGDLYCGVDVDDKNRVFYDSESLKWRLNSPSFKYYSFNCSILGDRPEPLFHTAVGRIDNSIVPADLKNLRCSPLCLYVGIGVKRKHSVCFNLPKFIKRSPFNLIFKDLTGGKLPRITKDNIFFQLLDFDVA